MQTITALHALIKALSWTFLHSLWIGLIGAFIAGIVVSLTKKKPSLFRYNVLTLVLFLFIFFTVFVSINEFNREFSALGSNNSGNSVSLNGMMDAPLIVHSTASYQNIIHNGINFFNENAAYFIAIWFFIFVFKLLRLFFSISQLERIKSEKLVTAPDRWTRRLEELKNQLNIKKSILLFESCLVKIPVTIGYAKPIILFPVGVLMNLPPNQVEAVLLHELAHIRRNDYLINLGQLVLEAIFFFNPCVLWISSLIRKERENCCDDLAISKIDSKKDFLSALLVFQDLAFAELKVAQSFSGSKTSLLGRVRRIVYSQNTSLNKVEKTSLFLVFAFLSLLAISFTKSSFPKNIAKEFRDTKTQNNSPDTTVKPKISVREEPIQKDKSVSNISTIKLPLTARTLEKNTATPGVVKATENSVPSMDELKMQTGNEMQQSSNSKDTGIVVTIDPVVYKTTVINDGNSMRRLPDTMPRPRSHFSRSNAAIASMIQDLKKENLIKDEGEKFTFLLSNEKLLVNGVRQPWDIHLKILGNYIQIPGEHINIYYECCR